MKQTTLHFEIARDDFARTRMLEQPLQDVQPGWIRFEIERFALTANNVTYAGVGDLLGYWDFFPTEVGWGRVPAMGWGRIVASAHPEIPTDGRYFGWFPMSRHVDIRAVATADGVRDDSDHRAAHAPIYRAYTATNRDPFYQSGEDAEDRHALLRGLFLTGFLADDFFAERDYHGARRVVVVSASSKTAIGFAQRASLRGNIEVVGLTSARNIEFLQGLGCYDRVLGYDDIETLPQDSDAVAIDMSGDGAVLERMHAHLAKRLRYSMAVGRSHNDAPAMPESAAGPKPELFFAPAQVEKRLQDWGPDDYRRRVADALASFVEGSRQWLELERLEGASAMQSAWSDALTGRVPANVGRIVSL